MGSLATRLQIMKESGFLDEDGLNDIEALLGVFRQNGIVLTEDYGGPLVTHICAAFRRCGTKEQVPPIPDIALEDIRQNENYELAADICGEILAVITHRLPEEETGYILLHICALLDKKRQEIEDVSPKTD